MVPIYTEMAISFFLFDIIKNTAHRMVLSYGTLHFCFHTHKHTYRYTTRATNTQTCAYGKNKDHLLLIEAGVR